MVADIKQQARSMYAAELRLRGYSFLADAVEEGRGRDDDLAAIAAIEAALASREPEYDRELIACMLESSAGCVESWTPEAMREQARLLRAADNRAADARTVNRTEPAASAGREAVDGVGDLYVECCECRYCNHVGINDCSTTDAACDHCDWSGPSPAEDKCPGCSTSGSMGAACPRCGGLYRFLAGITLKANHPAAVVDEAAVERVIAELRAYNPAADEHKGAHIHKVWAKELAAAIAAQQQEDGNG